jgi:RHS repeat-associated protein
VSELQVAQSPTELTSLRTYRSRTLDNHDGTRTLELHTDHIFYKDDQGAFEPVDLTLKDEGSYFAMENASYKLYVAKDFTADSLIRYVDRFEGANHTITFDPKVLAWVNKTDLSDHQIFREAQPVEGHLIAPNVIRFDNAFGPGINFEVTLLRSGFRKEIVIDSKDALEVPPAPGYELTALFRYRGDNLSVRSRDDAAAWDNASYFEKSNGFRIEEPGGKYSVMRPAVAFDAATTSTAVRVFWVRHNNALWQAKVLPIKFLRNATYPVRADTTVTYYPDANAETDTVDGAGETCWVNKAAGWSATRDTSSPCVVSDSTQYGYASQAYSAVSRSANWDLAYTIVRHYASFKYNIPSGSTIYDTKLHVYAHAKWDGDNDANAYTAVYQNSNTGAKTSLSSSDIAITKYDTDNPLSDSIDTSTVSGGTPGTHLTYDFNDHGLAVFTADGSDHYLHLGILEGHDADDVAVDYVSQDSGIGIYNAESAYDPALQVSYALTDVPGTPYALLTEGQTNPIGITDPTPEFSAIADYEDPDNYAVKYEIQVGMSPTDWTSPVWDSGKQELSATSSSGSRIMDIAYAGSYLAASTTYYWRIKLWDTNEIQGSWSTTTSSFALDVSSGFVVQDLSYTYDPVGNITRIVDAPGATTTYDYVYDPLNRLISASSTGLVGGDYKETYAYNAIGNITAKSDIGTYLYEGNNGSNYANPHAVTSVAGQTYTYDHAGNLTSGGGLTNTWNYKNQLTETDTASSTVTYAYDEEGQRVKIAGSETTYTPSRYYEETGTSSKRHIYLGGDLLATIDVQDGTTTPLYIHRDHLGSTQVITKDDQSLAERIAYYPFGGIRTDDQYGPSAERKKFTGHEYDEDTGLYYMQARYQNPEIGRFVSEDPVFWTLSSGVLASPQRMNSYSYANNNPVNLIDPTGTSALTSLIKAFMSILRMVGVLSTGTVTTSSSKSTGSSSGGGGGGSKTVPGGSTSVQSQNPVQVSLPNGWQTQTESDGCFGACTNMAGYHPNPKHSISTAVMANGQLAITSDAKDGVETIDEYLAAGRTPIVGVNWNGGTESRNDNDATQHFVVIYGSGSDKHGKYYNFADPGTAYESRGMSSTNKLYLNSNYSLSGKSAYNSDSKTYVVPEVRPE